MTALHSLQRAPQRAPRRARRTRALLCAATLGLLAPLVVADTAAAGTPTEVDVMAWLDATDPAMVIDQSANCMAGATDAVAYRGDRIVVRTGASNNATRAAINSRLNLIYGTPAGTNWVVSIERITFPVVPPATVITPVLVGTLVPRPGGAPHDILGLARRLRSESHVVAGPDYALVPSGPYSFFWPKGYPEKVNALTPPRSNLTPGGQPIGTGVKVDVYDTGLVNPNGGPPLTNVTKLDPGDNELAAGTDQMVRYPAAGHGRAIAGVLNVIAPGAAVEEVRISERNGVATDVTATREMAASLRTLSRPQWPQLIVNSFGTAACNVTAAVPGDELVPVGLEAVAETIDRFDPIQPKGMLIVASAGNVASTRRHYPAAFDSVVGVGALDGTIDGDGSPWSAPARTAPVAEFSNHGDWVDVYAPGVDLPTTHVNNLKFETDGDVIMGMATVDGTSFSAPLVVGLIAERMSTNNSRARDARNAIVNNRAAPLPPCGTTRVESGVSVTLASLSSPATSPPTGPAVTC